MDPIEDDGETDWSSWAVLVAVCLLLISVMVIGANGGCEVSTRIEVTNGPR